MAKIQILLFTLLVTLTSTVIGESADKVSPSNNIIGQVLSDNKRFSIQVQTYDQHHIPINQFHAWVITLHDGAGKPIDHARIAISGGMPAHGHGLPTQPLVTKYLENGRYLIEGMKFNMSGEWLIQFRIAAHSVQDIANLNVTINY